MAVINMQIKNITTRPRTDFEVSKLINNAFGEITSLQAKDMDIFLKNLKVITDNYLKKYNQAWKSFNNSFKIDTFKKVATDKKELKTGYSNISQQTGNRNKAVRFIRVLEEGEILLSYIRQLLSNQIIQTYFTVQGKDGELYYTSKKDINYRLALSNYGSSGNNYVSLAYNVNVPRIIEELKEDITKSITNKENEEYYNIYSTIWNIKQPYLDKYFSGQNKTPRWDSTDTEIFEFFRQNNARIEGLTIQWYRKLRISMGGKVSGLKEGESSGKKVTFLQLGDVGNIQDKYASYHQKQINFARQTLIYGHFKKLNEALSSNNSEEIRQLFLDLFSVEEDRVADAVSKEATRSVREHINALFDIKS